MSSKKNQPVKKIEAPAEEIITEQPKAQDYKASRNFFFAGKNWFEGEVVKLPQKDLEFLLLKQVIH